MEKIWVQHDGTEDAIATRLLAELEDERAWKTRFESTTNEQWDRLAQMVRQDEFSC